jgi:small subunit ribosomal protein S2
MAFPTFTMRQLLEAGVHFGHRAGRWNPKMAPYIFGERSNIHIIDLQQTVPMLYAALQVVRDTVASGGRVLFVGTKRQAAAKVAEAAVRCGQYYVDHRWLGGMMTNWNTVTASVKRLKSLNDQIGGEEETGLTKKELLQLTRERDKLNRALGGIQDMGALPNLLFIIDTNKEEIAVAEAKKLGIPVIAVVDTNSDPQHIDHPIPGNDDAIRAISLYCDLVADAVLDGIQAELTASGVDVGASEEAPAEELEAVAAAEAEAPAPEVAAEAAILAAAAAAAEASGPDAEAAVTPAAEAAVLAAAEAAAEAPAEEPAPAAETATEAPAKAAKTPRKRAPAKSKKAE